jgi:hypothetical protein
LANRLLSDHILTDGCVVWRVIWDTIIWDIVIWDIVIWNIVVIWGVAASRWIERWDSDYILELLIMANDN